MSPPVATRAGPEETGSTRSPADVAPTLTVVPRPVADEAVVGLSAVAGGLEAVQAEWGVDGGAVVLTGAAPFVDLTGRAGFRSDGALDGTVRMRARVGLLGLDLAEATWTVDGWTPDVPLPAPGVALRGSTLAVDLRGLPAEAAFTTTAGLESARTPEGATITLPTTAVPPGQPLSPRLVEAYRGLLGVDLGALGDLRVHPDTEVAGVPAFVSDRELFFAPGVYGVDAPEPLRLVDAAIRSALADLVAPVTEPAASGGPAAETVPAEPAPEAAVVPTPEENAPEEIAPEETPAAAAAGVAPAPVEEVAPEAGAAEEAPPPPVELIMPEPPTELTPAAAARGGGVAGGAGGAARAARDLPPAEESVADARGAVTEPAAETAARAREELAAELGERPPPSPEIVALCERIRTAIYENRPEDEDELLETGPTREAQQAGGTITGAVEGQVQEVGDSYDAMATPPSGTPALTPVPVTTPDPSAPGMGVDAASAAPDPIPPENTTLDADVAATDQRIADSGIDTRVTREIPDGPFAEVREARGELGEAAERTPQQIQAEQQQAIDTAQSDMAQLQLQAVAAMRSARSGTVEGVGAGQGGMVQSEQQTRESVSQRAQQIFDDAQRAVDTLLEPLGRTAIARWEAGLARLSQEFHDSLDRVKRWIEERHSGVGGAIVAIGDYIAGLPDWVTDEYNRAERAFGDGVTELLLDISSDVNGVVAAARAIIQHARTDIDAAFTAMEAEFPEWAAQERARFSGMLDGLDQRVTAAQTGFVRDVSQRATQAVNEVHAEAQALRDAAGGLVGRVVAAIEEFIDDPVRAIINGLLRLVGIPPSAFWGLIARIEQVISDIADDPESFINNLVAGVKQGFQQFFDNFGTHVLRGFWDWLFSGLETPIPMPRDFSPGSLFSFALQLMGITWPRVREILVRHIGPTAVEVIEAAWQLISVLIERGPEGIVELIKEQLTPENIVGMILEAAVEYLVETLIQQVVMRVIGMLNPAGAIAQAIDLIYQVCSWIFRNAARIFRFVEAVVNGMADVVAGNIGGLANAVERALASLIPPVIDFLAGLLHLGGLPGEVADVITQLQATVHSVLDRVIGFLAEQGRALLRRMGLGGEEEDGDGHGSDDDELGTTVRFSAAGESHRLWIQTEGGSNVTLMVASTPTPVEAKIADWRSRLSTLGDDDKEREATALLADLEAVTSETDQMAELIAVQFLEQAQRARAAAGDAPDPGQEVSDDPVENKERAMAGMLDRLFTIFDPEGQNEARKASMRTHLPRHGENRAQFVRDGWLRDQIANVRAKPIAGAEGAVFDPLAFTVSALVPTEVLASSANHGSLLSFWDSRRTGMAETDTFAEYALVNAGTPHPVRAQFHRGLGRNAVALIHSQGEARLSAEGDSELLATVRRIRYDYDESGIGSFAPWPTNPVSVLVQGVARTGLLAAFAAFVRGDPVGAVRFEEFRDELLRDQRSRTWLSGQVRNLTVGTHEWMPVSIALEVLDHAVTVGRDDLRRGMGWISLIQSLRTPTDSILWRITRDPVIVPGGPVEEGTQVAPAGHVSTLSLDRYTLVQDGLTVGTGEFHDALRDFFRANRSMDPASWVDALLAHLPSIMWTGGNVIIPLELRNRPIGVFYSMPAGFTPDLTVAQVTAEQQQRWERIQAAFRAAKAALP